MFYTIYKTTNLVNGKFYIGKHKTKDLDDDIETIRTQIELFKVKFAKTDGFD